MDWDIVDMQMAKETGKRRPEQVGTPAQATQGSTSLKRIKLGNICKNGIIGKT